MVSRGSLMHWIFNRGLIVFLILGLYTQIWAADPKPDQSMAPADPVSADQVSIDFSNVDINVFIKFMSRLTSRNFVVDNRVKGSVTIISPKKMTVDEAWHVFESVLDIHGFATVESGSVTKIVPAVNARADNVDTALKDGKEKPSDRIVTRIIPLHYASSDELRALLMPLIPKGSILLSYRDTNVLILTSTLAGIERLIKIIETIDIESIGRKITILQVKYADAAKLVKSLTTIYSAQFKNVKNRKNVESMVNFVADERTNSVIFLASELETRRIVSLVETLDKKVPKGEERIRVYYLEHATAEELAKVLQEIPSGEDKKTPGQKKAPLLSQDIKITADKATNSLLIIADKDDYPVLEEVIRKLDIPRAMVYIECLIMEVNADKGLNLGTEWRVSEGFNGNDGVVLGGFGGTGDAGFSNINTAKGGTSLPKGFSVGVLGKNLSIGGVIFPSLQAVIQAYRTDKDVQILSTPQILTTENEEARINVGKNVPYQTRSAAESGTETYSSFEYKDVGITLKITPAISQDRLVRLSVYQKVERLDTASVNDPNRPTTLKRELETTILVEDANTVVIGGLIDESLSKTVGRMPCLGSIPVLGWGFKSNATGSEKTNLYVFLTPRVVKNPVEAKELYDEKNEEIRQIKKEEIRLYDDELLEPFQKDE